MPARLLGKAVDHREPKAAALARRLGREEGLQGVDLRLLRHPRAGIGHGKEAIVARRELGLPRRIGLVHVNRGGLDAELTTARHGIAGVEDEVEKRRLDLPRIGERRPEIRARQRRDLDGLPQGAAQDRHHPGDDLVQIDRLGLQDLPASKGQEPAHQLRPARGRIQSSLRSPASSVSRASSN